MKKILIIEDNDEVRENLAEVLALSDYEVVQAANGVKGVEQALLTSPDLILCDVMMPELDGYGVLHILSKKPKTTDIPFIFLTAKAEKEDLRKGMNLGADDYITKPFKSTELLDAIDLRLRKSERIKKAFNGTAQGLSAFINEARGQAELEKLSEGARHREYKKMEMIYREGDLPRQLFFVVSGKVKSYRVNEFGKELISEIWAAGDFFGHQALIREAVYRESAEAMEAVELALISKEDFLKLLYHNRDFSAHFIKMLAGNVEEKEERLLSLAYNSIRKRVANVLVSLHQKNTEASGIHIQRDDLASMVGTAKESVIRTLTDFRKEGLIAIEGGVIMVLDAQKIASIPG